jgi:predicted nucleic acid-binding protein
MARRKTFLDTSGFYCALVPDDPRREKVDACLHDPGRIFYTTDWIIGETVNLLTARRKPHLARKFLRQIESSAGLQIVYGNREIFEEAKALLFQYEDQAFPFTDCVSFAVMRSLKIQDVLTSDGHFKVMGFGVLLET